MRILKSKEIRLLFVLTICVCLFIGCSKEKEINSNSIDVNDNQTVTETNKETETLENAQTDSESLDKEKESTKENDTKLDPSSNADLDISINEETTKLAIYTIDSETLELKDTSAIISNKSELTPELIVDEVIKKLAEMNLVMVIESITKKEDMLIVSFQKDATPFTNEGSGVESTILDAIGMSLLDNLKDYKKVIYRVEGKAYESGHISLGIDEAYLEN